MREKVMLTCAVTGNFTTLALHPGPPVMPEEIAEPARDAATAGAAAALIHLRDPETGTPSMRLDLYGEVMDRIRAGSRDLVINLTTVQGSRFEPSEADPKVASPLAPNNATLVEKAARIPETLGASLSSLREARQMLGLGR